MSGLNIQRRLGKFGAWLAFAVTMIMAPASHADDLMAIYHRALENDASFASARYSLEMTKQKLPQAVSALLPVVAVNATAQRTYGDTQYTGYDPVTRGVNASAWTLQLTQPIVRFQNIYGYEESRHLVAQAQAQFEQAQQDLIIRTAQAYFDVILAQNAITVAKDQRQSAAEQQAVAQHGFEDGTASITDVDEARARAELAGAQVSAAQSDLEAKQAALQQIIGDDWAPQVLAPLSTHVALPRPNPEAVDSWVSRARDDNPSVRAAKAVRDAATVDIARARALYLPTVDLIASFGSNYSNGNTTEPVNFGTRVNDKQIGLQLNMPILDGGGLHSQDRQAKFQQDKASADWEVARRQAATDARQAFSAIESGLSQVRALQSAVDSTAHAVKGNEAGYRAGLRINSDVLDSQQQLGSAEQSLEKAKVDLIMQGLKLKAAAGILTEADLDAVNRLLSLSIDDDSVRG